MVGADVCCMLPVREPVIEIVLSTDEPVKASLNKAAYEAKLFPDYLCMIPPFPHYNRYIFPVMSDSSQNHLVFLCSYQFLNTKAPNSKDFTFLISTLLLFFHSN